MRVKVAKSDSWGFALEVYPCDKTLIIVFIHWYLLIEKNYE